MAKTQIKIPRNLQLEDEIYVIKEDQLTPDSEIVTEISFIPQKTVKFYRIERIPITSIGYEDNKKRDRIVINNTVSIEANGSLKDPEINTPIVDETLAIETTKNLIKSQIKFVENILSFYEKELKGLKENLKIYDGKNKLNSSTINVTIETNE